LFFQRVVSTIRWSRLALSSMPTASFYKATYEGIISSWNIQEEEDEEKKKYIIQYIKEKKYIECPLSICYWEHLDFWVVWNHCVILYLCEVKTLVSFHCSLFWECFFPSWVVLISGGDWDWYNLKRFVYSL